MLRLLVAADAAFWPNRTPTPRLNAIVYELRKRHAVSGQPWKSGGKDSRDWTAASRTLAELHRRGWVHVERGAVRTTGARLSDQGDQIARELWGLPSIAETLPIMERLASLGEWDHGELGQFHPEIELLTPPRNYSESGVGRALYSLCQSMLPALVRQWVESNTDCHGRAWFRLTELGRSIVNDPDAVEFYPVPPRDNADPRIYYRAFDQAVEALAEYEPENRHEIGALLMPVSSGYPYTVSTEKEKPCTTK
jgi:hypothetical protein